MSYVKKSQLFGKKYKIENRSGGRPSKTFLKSIFDFEYFLVLRAEKEYLFFKKLRLFYIELRLDIFFEIHNSNKK